MKRSKLLLLLVLAPFFLHAQGGKEAEKQLIIEQLIEDIAGTLGEDEELDYTNLFEDLAMYYDNPLDLNSASIQELRDLNLLSDIQINHLQLHIAKYGSLKTIFELQAVEGFTLQSIRQIKPFVTVGATSFLTDFTWGFSFLKRGRAVFFCVTAESFSAEKVFCLTRRTTRRLLRVRRLWVRALPLRL
jgi:hypothetical protein